MSVPCLVYTNNVVNHRTSLRSYGVTCKTLRRVKIGTLESVQKDVPNKGETYYQECTVLKKVLNSFLYMP